MNKIQQQFFFIIISACLVWHVSIVKTYQYKVYLLGFTVFLSSFSQFVQFLWQQVCPMYLS